MMLLVVMLLISMEKYSRRKQQLYQKNTGQEQRELIELSGGSKWLAIGWCWLLVTLGFLLPSLVLVEYLIAYFDDSWSSALFEYGINSLMVSGSAAAVACFIALFLGVYQRLQRTSFSRIPARLAATGYALPGNVLAIGVLIPLTLSDNVLNELLIHWHQSPVGLIFSGSAITLVFAYVVRFSAVAVGSVESSLGRVSPSLDMASRTLGCNPGEMVKRVHLPLIRKGMLAGLLLVFIEGMKELPATLLLRPFNFETLATRVFQYVSDEQLEYAAPAALVLVLVGLVPLIMLNRSLERQEQQ
ncbi:ABC transporter permease subunit [Endozoicomonas sp. GU-1]|nr:ABC transporter permease subunit [Endozoicomonas sp. GU-1]WBA81728.1 ABC transporter permease subunit [Endozoicomonas sp. GU-1]